MSLVKVRDTSQVTLPSEFLDALEVDEGDFMEAQLVEGGVLLRPLKSLPEKSAWQALRAAMATVRPDETQAAKPLGEQEAEIRAVVDEVRHDYADERRS